MTHPTDEKLDALDAKLASQIGDDISVIFNHEYLFKQSRDAIAALRAQLTEVMAAERDYDRRQSDHKSVIIDKLNSMLTREKEAHAAANARADRAEAALAAQIEVDASRAHDHLRDWASDLAWTRDSLIDAQTTGVWNGRRVNDKSWLKFEARMFGERAEAVAESAEHTAAAIRNQPHDRTALDRMLRAEREKALREAADRFPDGRQPWPPHAIRAAILALIPREDDRAKGGE